MMIGDIETSFTYLHNAVKEDEALSNVFEGYPENAPGFQIVTLDDNPNNFMSPYVRRIREFIKVDLDLFSRTFKDYSDFRIEEFDKIFLKNKELNKNKFYRNLKFNVAYYLWNTYEYLMKSVENIEYSEFDNLNRLNKILGMCVVLDDFFKEKLKLNKKASIRYCTKKIYKILNGNPNDMLTLIEKVSFKDDNLQQILKELIKFEESQFEGCNISYEIRCLLLYYLVRNFSAHNAKSIPEIGKSFRSISQNLFFLFLLTLKKFT